jgi:hypothetical protein
MYLYFFIYSVRFFPVLAFLTSENLIKIGNIAMKRRFDEIQTLLNRNNNMPPLKKRRLNDEKNKLINTGLNHPLSMLASRDFARFKELLKANLFTVSQFRTDKARDVVVIGVTGVPLLNSNATVSSVLHQLRRFDLIALSLRKNLLNPREVLKDETLRYVSHVASSDDDNGVLLINLEALDNIPSLEFYEAGKAISRIQYFLRHITTLPIISTEYEDLLENDLMLVVSFDLPDTPNAQMDFEVFVDQFNDCVRDPGVFPRYQTHRNMTQPEILNNVNCFFNESQRLAGINDVIPEEVTNLTGNAYLKII